MTNIDHRIGPFHYADAAHKAQRTFKVGKARRTFTIVLSTAYNAFGLIGPEFNGLAVLDDDNMAVVADRIAEANHGTAPTRSQLELFQRVTTDEAFTYADLAQLVNSSDRNRYEL